MIQSSDDGTELALKATLKIYDIQGRNNNKRDI